MVITARAPNVPRKMTAPELLAAKSAYSNTCNAIKNVLSPSSEKKINRKA